MSDLLTPGNTVTFTISRLPRREATRKTLQRLMRLQPEIQKGLKRLQHRRKRVDNVYGTRAGRPWVARVKATRLTTVEPGESFTLLLTPQILADVRSVSDYVTTAAG